MTAINPREALLGQKVERYLSGMEDPTARVDYSRMRTDRLLVIEALNDWCGRILGEGGEIQLTSNCDDPCCATPEEAERIIRLVHHDTLILYPVSAFNLVEHGSALGFSPTRSKFRMRPHIDGSCASGIGIAEASGIRDIDAAMRLWVMSVVEDCVAYMACLMGRHGLLLEDEELRAVRSILTSAIQDRFSLGQIYNAVWRTVKDAAANSTLQYSSSAKAAKAIPKKLDKIVTQAGASLAAFPHYERIAAVPMGALLTLFLNRFRIGHRTTRSEACDLLLDHVPDYPLERDALPEASQSAVAGVFHFLDVFTPLDRLVVAHCNPVSLGSHEPEWEGERSNVGTIRFVLSGLYDFDGSSFVRDLLPLLGADLPSEEEIARHAADAAIAAEEPDYVDPTGWTQALEDVLGRTELPEILRHAIAGVARFPVEPSEVLRLVQQLPLPSGLVAIRVDHAYIDGGYVDQSSTLSVLDFQISIPESTFSPDGNDKVIVSAVIGKDEAGYADLLGTAMARLVCCNEPSRRAQVLRAISRKLNDAADRLLDQRDVTEPPAQAD